MGAWGFSQNPTVQACILPKSSIKLYEAALCLTYVYTIMSASILPVQQI